MVIFVPKSKEDKRAIFENIWYRRSSEYKSLGLAWNLLAASGAGWSPSAAVRWGAGGAAPVLRGKGGEAR